MLVWLLLSTAQGLGSILLCLGVVEALFFWMTTLEFSTVGLSWVWVAVVGQIFCREAVSEKDTPASICRKWMLSGSRL